MVHESELFSFLLQTEAHPEAALVLVANAERFRSRGVVARAGDARVIPPEAPFDYVDLDPYGTPVPFLVTALGALAPGGVLAVTATDMMVLAGVQPKVCGLRYGARPVRGRLGPEGGLRILLKHLAEAARARGRVLHPLLCYVHDHHVRAYVEIAPSVPTTGPDPIAMIDPAAWTGPSLGSSGPVGPMWLGPLFDAALVRSMRAPARAERPREITGFLERLAEEADVDRPFYYECNELARAMGLAQPPSYAAMRDGLVAVGARCARTHARSGAFRSDAPRATVERVAIDAGTRIAGPTA
jgi:tRNA (guanine26-N2/guanine27-N2)-dimethyltransferase